MECPRKSFIYNNGVPLLYRCVALEWRNLSQRWDNFRHTKASHLVETNVPIIYIKDFLGHESIDTTLIYSKINGKIKNETIINNSLKLDNQEIIYHLNDNELLDWLDNL